MLQCRRITERYRFRNRGWEW